MLQRMREWLGFALATIVAVATVYNGLDNRLREIEKSVSALNVKIEVLNDRKDRKP